ncbi:hypothetical protein LSM04_006022 [Trypanosoma melophagium]|uniref:uncharacterized protein n=1 Tax=Trypanosoma melophagium TaxID=715481 RepID=UPI00351A0104|nr:hypothetical protein LSM04_006022 [Trypanosoma melophagium]
MLSPVYVVVLFITLCIYAMAVVLCLCHLSASRRASSHIIINDDKCDVDHNNNNNNWVYEDNGSKYADDNYSGIECEKQ